MELANLTHDVPTKAWVSCADWADRGPDDTPELRRDRISTGIPGPALASSNCVQPSYVSTRSNS